MDSMQLKDPFEFEGPALSLPLVFLSPRIDCHCSSTMTKDNSFEIKLYDTEWPCVPIRL